MPIGRIGQDFIVNTTTTGNQFNPSITALANGRLVVTWESYDAGDGSGTSIRGRIYNANGSAAGDDFIVNSTATNSQYSSSVTALANGQFVATWTSDDNGDGSGGCIRGRLYDGNGVAAGSDFIVNTTTANSQYASSVTSLPDGRFIVTWTSEDKGEDSLGGGVRARLYSANGSAAGDDFLVNTTTTNDQRYPSVTALADGRFVVTWYSVDGGDGDGTCIRGRLYDANGNAAGSDFVVNSTAKSNQYIPSIAGLTDGRFVVTWYARDGGDGSGDCIRGRLYDANGAAVGNDFVVNSTATGNQTDPSVTGLADGRFVVTWISHEPGDGDGTCIRGRLYNVDGSAAGEDFVVNTTGANSQSAPVVTAFADGRFAVAWHSTDPGDGSGTCIRAQVFDPAIFTGTTGADIWKGGNLYDNISGGDGHDTLSGGRGSDGIYGGDGNDTLSGDAGADALYGGDGIDTASYASSGAGVTVNLAAQTGTGADAERDFLAQIENLVGSAFADTLIGDAGNNVLDGGAGDDTAVFAQNLGHYSLQQRGDKILVSGPDGHDTLASIEHLQFADGTLHVTDDGNPLFDTLHYLSRNPDVFHAGVNALDHYNTFGWHEGRDPSAFFDTSGYLAVNTDVAASGMNPLEHYHQSGWREGRDPSAWFDTELYLIRNPDVAAAGIDPLAHFLQFGRAEGREPDQAVGQTVNGFDAQYYLFHNPDVAAAGVDPLFHFNVIGWKEGRDPNGWFDTSGYLSYYGDVAAAGINPFDHYMAVGWKEGRDASTWFDTTGYLALHPDVAAAGVNPLDHFLQFGIYEGRQAVNDGVWG